jgi:hypothetical protein
MRRNEPNSTDSSLIAALLADLDDMLERERAALLAGDLEGLSRVLREKERLIDAVNKGLPGDSESLGVLKTKASRNQALLGKAEEGIRVVADRVSALRRVRETLETYDQSGRKTTLESLHKGRVEKRA